MDFPFTAYGQKRWDDNYDEAGEFYNSRKDYLFDDDDTPYVDYETRCVNAVFEANVSLAEVEEPCNWTEFKSLTKNLIQDHDDPIRAAQLARLENLLKIGDRCDPLTYLRLTGHPYALPEEAIRYPFYIDDVDEIYFFDGNIE